MEKMLEVALNEQLKDDETMYGGVSTPDETLKDFLEDTNEELPKTMEEYLKNKDKYNKMLIECGIKPLTI